MQCDPLDTVALGQVLLQTVKAIGFVACQSRREGIEEAVPENASDELTFVSAKRFRY